MASEGISKVATSIGGGAGAQGKRNGKKVGQAIVPRLEDGAQGVPS